MRRSALPAAILCALAGCSDAPSPAPTQPVAPAPASLSLGGGSVPIPGRYIVRYRSSALDWQLRAQSAASGNGSSVQRYFTSVFKGAVLQLSDSAAQALLADPNVISVEQDQMLSIAATQTNATWGLDRIDQRTRPLTLTYTYSSSGVGVTVYIVDTGIDFSHTGFQGRATTGVDYITPNGTGADCNGHGTHVAGTVGSATYGVAKQVNLKAVRVLDCSGRGPLSGVIAAVDWITINATRPAVVNMSLAGALSSSLNAAVESSIASGITYAVAAGNATATACSASPSSAPSGITVGATDAADVFASWSNFGSCVHILAPGVNITSLWLGNGSANTLSGTSMASPHVAGAAALYLQANPAATPAQVRAALVSNATPGVATGVPVATPNLLLYTGFMSLQPAPVANFASSCSVLLCTFDASATTALSNATYTWTYGDAASGTGVSTSHLYAAPGTYTVTLTVADANGSSSKTGAVTVFPNQPPTAVISTPVSGTTFMRDWAAVVTIAFAGTANDPETGSLAGASLVWRSSLDGQIGTGPSFSKTNLSLGTHVITLTATDAQGAVGSATATIIVVPLYKPPPTVVITAPTANSSHVRGAMVTFAGTGTDTEGPLTGASLVWTSSRDGAIGTGSTFVRSDLSTGAHTVTLTATNHKGIKGTATVNVTISAPVNLPPSASITAPVANSSAVLGASVTFAGTAADPETGALSGASLVWTSNRDGQIGTGGSFARASLALGVHIITLTASDAQGSTGSASVTITIVPPPNQAPTAAISAPSAGSTFVTGASVAFAGSGNDPETGPMSGSSLAWSSSRDGQIGTGTSFSKANLTLGAHTITLVATDAQGATGSATRTITVVSPPNQPPTTTISTPAANSSAVLGASVSFSGAANDPETGAMSGASMVWSSNRDGVIGTGTSFSKSNLTLGTHTITLVATDAQGATGSSTTTLTIVAAPNQPPTAAISSPSAGTSVVQGTSVSFVGSGNDPETGVMSGASLAWTSSRDGQLGTGASFSSTSLSVGTHTITLTATDAKGAIGQATRTISVTLPNQAPAASISSPAAGENVAQGALVSFVGTGTDPEQGALGGGSLVWTSSRDGQIGTGTSFTKSNLSAGTHAITLTATDAQGATGSVTRTLAVAALISAAPTAAFTVECGPTVSATPHTCFLDGRGSTGAIVTWVWGLGTGQPSSRKVPTGTYTWPAAGTYTVTLTVTDAGRLTASTSQVVVVP